MTSSKFRGKPGQRAPVAGSIILLLFVLWAIWTAIS
jgi:hypothetical protein